MRCILTRVRHGDDDMACSNLNENQTCIRPDSCLTRQYEIATYDNDNIRSNKIFSVFADVILTKTQTSTAYAILDVEQIGSLQTKKALLLDPDNQLNNERHNERQNQPYWIYGFHILHFRNQLTKFAILDVEQLGSQKTRYVLVSDIHTRHSNFEICTYRCYLRNISKADSCESLSFTLHEECRGSKRTIHDYVMILNDNITHIDGYHSSVLSTSIEHNDRHDSTKAAAIHSIIFDKLINAKSNRYVPDYPITDSVPLDSISAKSDYSDVSNIESAANALPSLKGHGSSVSLPAQSKCNSIDPMTTAAIMHLYDVATTDLVVQNHSTTIMHTTRTADNDDNIKMHHDGQLITDTDIYQHQIYAFAIPISSGRLSYDYPSIVIDSNPLSAYIDVLMLCIIVPSTWLPYVRIHRSRFLPELGGARLRRRPQHSREPNSARLMSALWSASTATQEKLLYDTYDDRFSLT